MTRIVLYIAATIDGFIARKNGSLDWLEKFPDPENAGYGYESFLSTIDTVFMGRNTYEEVLSFGTDWPYGNMKTYVVTRDKKYNIPTPSTILLNEIDNSGISEIISSSMKNIWICGGGQLITEFLRHGYIDEMILFIIPVILGNGIQLFPGNPAETYFELVEVTGYSNGVVKLVYRKKGKSD